MLVDAAQQGSDTPAGFCDRSMMPNPGMLLSIIVPCLNEAANIMQSLQALAPYRARGAEVLVVDGGSTDGSAEAARPLADRVICAPRGRARQMNAGAAIARGDILLFMHVDCRLPYGADDLMSSGLARGGFQWGRFDIAIEGSNALLRVVAAAMNRRSRWTGIATGDQGIFVTRSAFDAVGGYPPLALMEDIELSTRLKRVSRPLCIREPIVTSGRRWEKHGVLRTIVLMWFLRLAYWLGADTGRLAKFYATHRS